MVREPFANTRQIGCLTELQDEFGESAGLSGRGLAAAVVFGRAAAITVDRDASWMEQRAWNGSARRATKDVE